MSCEDIQLSRAREAASTELSDIHDELYGFYDKKGGPPKGSACLNHEKVIISYLKPQLLQ